MSRKNLPQEGSEEFKSTLWVRCCLTQARVARSRHNRQSGMPLCCAQHNYCFFIISHDRRRILHLNVTKHPTSGWIIQQLREAFPFEASHKYLIFDRDQKFAFEVIAAVKKATRIIPKRTSFRSPWQNGIAERWVGSCRRASWTTWLH